MTSDLWFDLPGNVPKFTLGTYFSTRKILQNGQIKKAKSPGNFFLHQLQFLVQNRLTTMTSDLWFDLPGNVPKFTLGTYFSTRKTLQNCQIKRSKSPGNFFLHQLQF